MTDYRKTRVPVDIKAGPHKGEDGWERYSYRIRSSGPEPRYLTFFDTDSVVDRPALPPRVPLRGACMHLWGSPDWKRELGLIHDAGANVVRFDLNWINPATSWNNGQAVKTIDVMAELRRLGLRAIVSFLTAGVAPADDVTRKEYATSAELMCRTFKDVIAALEVWNEPNGEGNMTPAAYAALVKATYPAVKAAAPDVPVIVGSLARVDTKAVAWLGQAVAVGMPPCDGLAVHPYSSAWPVSMIGTALDVTGLKALYDATKIPQWVTEFGCSTVSKTVDPNYSVDEDTQATLIANAWQDVDTLPFVRAATLYNCVENGGDTIWGRWGVVRRDWTLKPAYTTFKAGITR